ncbi:MAG: hypothetical protein WC763_00330 [Candidatus Paceibacterota bacterium]|jgi:hypothetical protein
MSESSVSETTAGQGVKAKAVVIINTIITHARPHWDETVGITLIQDYGKDTFDTSGASIITVKGDPKEIEAYAKRPDLIMIGVGGDLVKMKGRQCFIFDEHGLTDKKCAADLVAEYLGVDERLMPLLIEVRESDLERKNNPLSMATVLKVSHDQRPHEEAKVIELGLRAAKAICVSLLGTGLVAKDPDTFLVKASEAYVKIGGANGVKPIVFKNLIEQLQVAAAAKTFSEISTVFYIMQAENREEAGYWLSKVLTDLVRRHVDFDRALEDFNSNHDEISVPFGNNGATIRVAFMKMEKEYGLMDQVFRCKQAGGCDMLILKNTRGQVCIFTNDKGQKGRFDLDPLARMIRWAEIAKSKRHPEGWWSLSCDRDHPGVCQWHYFKKGSMLLNGSKSKPDVPATRLGYEDFVYILGCAFSANGIRQFIKDSQVDTKK